MHRIFVLVIGAIAVGLATARAVGAQCATPTPMANAGQLLTLYASRDTMIPEAHKMNNDGGWGYGWIKVSQGAHNYGLLGFDVSGLVAGPSAEPLDPDTDILRAVIKLRVAQNHFAEDGQDYEVYAWRLELANQMQNWSEGTNRFDLFSYCSQSDWARPAAQNDPQAPAGSFAGPGATWTCSQDADTRDGSVACAPPVLETDWETVPESVERVPLGFSLAGAAPTPVAVFTGKKSYQPSDPSYCQYCGTLASGIERNCNPLCGKSIECFQSTDPHPDASRPELTAADVCFRTVTIDVSASLREFVNAGVADPSWLIRRKTNSGAGAFHYFSREGAVCILGECGRAPSVGIPAGQPGFFPDYRQLMPVLEVQLRAGVTPPATIDTPIVPCVDAYPGPLPPSGNRCGIPTPTATP